MERVVIYFVEALYSRVSSKTGRTAPMFETSSEDFTLPYKALNDDCPVPIFEVCPFGGDTRND
uniref:Uncharacterized protein n=1 Tax=Nelumbo nucifera TaxID=4432 RepID=A0A822ZFU6_NELNU|nr:TPA_asm: hypothetical protein HUJ06_003264 [Nelumbo nucifera]